MTQDIHDRHGSGFVHLGSLLPEVAKFCPTDRKPRERRGTTGGREPPEFLDENALQENYVKAFREEWELGGAGGKRERRDRNRRTSVDIRCKALALSRELDDERSLAFYKLVIRKVPEYVIRDALMRALDTPRQAIRKSRGALFASIVRPHLPSRTSNRPKTPNPH